jgi:pimeloyl-ACP methyl ester carboxylesterase
MPKNRPPERRRTSPLVRRTATFLTLLCCCTSAAAAPPDCVILLHGLARTSDSMASMQAALEQADYQVVNLDYPSRHYNVDQLADLAVTPAIAACPADSKLHFVSHSLGGIVLRHYLEQHPLPRLGHVVMLGPPNQGSEIVDTLREVPGFAWLNGPAGLQLGTTERDLPRQLEQPDFSLGIIAGTQSINLLLSTLLPNPDDGKVSVQSTKLAGMSDHISLPVTHPLMMRDDQVITQTLHFLRYGHFAHTPAASHIEGEQLR